MYGATGSPARLNYRASSPRSLTRGPSRLFTWRFETFREVVSLNICKAVLLLFCAITELFTDFQCPPYSTGGNVNSSECVLRAPLLGREPALQPWARCPLALSPQSLASLLFPLQGPNSALNVLDHLINPPLLRLSNWPYSRLL